MSEPLVSVICPTFHQHEYLSTAILSVIAQTHPNIELIVVSVKDDQETSLLISKTPIVPNWRHIESEKADHIHQINLGLKEARGEFTVLFGSVPHYTPIIVRNQISNEVDVFPISELASFSKNEREVLPVRNLEVYVGPKQGTWAKIEHVVRYPFSGILYRINTYSGLVDVTKEHSLMLWHKGKGEEAVRGEDVKVGMVISHPPLVHSWILKRGNNGFFFGNEGLAWFYGFFAAEGSVSGRVISIANTNSKLLDKALTVIENFFGRKLDYYEDRAKYEEGHKKQFKICLARNQRMSEFFREKFYTKSGDKRVPRDILNAPKNIQQAFLEGYCAGDGSKTSGGRSWRFWTVSHTLAMSILYLVSRTTNQSWSLRYGEDNCIDVTLNIPEELKEKSINQKFCPGQVRNVTPIHYSGFVYDIATVPQVFVGGVGRLKLHNSDDFMLPNKIERELSVGGAANAVLVYSRFFICDEHLNIQVIPPIPQFSYQRLVQGNFIVDSCLVAKTMYEEFGLLEESLGSLAVYDKWLHIAEKYEGNIIFNSVPVILYRTHSQQKHVQRLADPHQPELYERVVKASLTRKGLPTDKVKFKLTQVECERV